MTQTQVFVKTSGRAAGVFLGLLNSINTANVPMETRLAWSLKTLDAYQPMQGYILPPLEQLTRLRVVLREWKHITR